VIRTALLLSDWLVLSLIDKHLQSSAQIKLFIIPTFTIVIGFVIDAWQCCAAYSNQSSPTSTVPLSQNGALLDRNEADMMVTVIDLLGRLQIHGCFHTNLVII